MTTKITADNIEQSTLDILGSSGPAVANVKITSNSYVILDDTAVSTDGGYIIINGSNFEPNVNVLIDQTAATSVTRVSATQLRVQVPALSAGSKILYVVNSDTGATTILLNGVTYSGTPTWVTGSTLTGGVVDAAISIQLSASSDSNVSYQLQAGSTLPAGLTLAANGLLSGTVTGITENTLYNFTVEAVDTENQDSPRSFTITILVSHQISRSLRFNSADSAYLSRTPASAGNRRTMTYSVWVKRATTNSEENIFSAGDGAGGVPREFMGFASAATGTVADSFTVGLNTTGGAWIFAYTNALLRDLSAWYHIVIAIDTTQATSSNRVKIYINGVQQTLSGSYPTQNTDLLFNSTNVQRIGRFVSAGGYLKGYLTEINFVDGQQLTPSSFGETDADTGVWSPIAYAGSYGTNGFYLDFSDNSDVTATTLGKDQAGSNNWTPYNFSVAAGAGNDSLVDSPTRYGTDTGAGGEVRGNYATLNPLAKDADITLANGNLDFSCSSAGLGGTIGTIAVTSGKWYWEVTPTSGTSGFALGIAKLPLSAYDANQTGTYLYLTGGNKRLSPSTDSAYGASYTDNDVIGVALDMDAGTVTFYKNNASQGTAFSSLSGEFTAWVQDGSNGIASVANINFGQRPFAYTAPAGFKALCTTNLPEPAVVQGDDYFNTVLYTGTGSDTQSITGVGFQPDFIWIKNRSDAYSHVLQDVVRGFGATKKIASSSTNAEGSSGPNGDNYGHVSTSDSDGFTLTHTINASNDGGTIRKGTHFSGNDYAAWNWKANGAGVSNTDGTIASTVSVSTTSGFSIVTYTGNGGNAPATIGHGLGVAPQMMILKFRDASSAWSVYHASLGNTKRLTLNTTAAESTGYWNNTSPTSTVFTVGPDFNQSSVFNYVVYCFAEVEGYSKFGSYTGNGSADGPFIYTGFRPAFVILKAATVAATNWQLNDSARDTFNVVNKRLAPSAADAEATNFNFGDFLSNGFKIRQTDQTWNTNGATYIYMAFAENPFKYSLAR